MFSANSFESTPVVREDAMFELLFGVESGVESGIVCVAGEGLEGIVVCGDGVGEGERGYEGQSEKSCELETHYGMVLRFSLGGCRNFRCRRV